MPEKGDCGCVGEYTPHNISEPWETVAVDLMGPKPTGINQYKWLLVILDNYTKYVELFPLSTATGAIVAAKFHEVGCRHGFPKKIISDNGPQFISNVYKEYCKKMGVKRALTSPFNPSANPTERANRNLKMMLAIFSDVHSHWPRYLNDFAFASRTGISEATGSTPMLLNTGRNVPPPWNPRIISHAGKLDKNNPQEYVNRLLVTIKNAMSIMCDRVQKNYERHRDLHNKKYNIISFEINDLVWKKTHYLSAKEEKFSAGLAKRRDEPWRIIKVLGGHAYKLEKLADGSIEPSVNIKQLTPYIPEFPIEFWLEGQDCASKAPQDTPNWVETPTLVDLERSIASKNNTESADAIVSENEVEDPDQVPEPGPSSEQEPEPELVHSLDITANNGGANSIVVPAPATDDAMSRYGVCNS
uniref:Integrase catalytic domain-containing protein n=1 Tax=Strigamia maritima TaxID=126957 RepID=T1IGQ9_STRMM